MPIPQNFSYKRPSTIDQAIKLMEKHNHHYALLAGGTDLICNLKAEMINPQVIIDLKAIKDLHKIKLQKDCLHIGALVTYTEIIESSVINEHFPVLAQAASKVASCGIRNRATMVGNICSAVPCLDAGAPLMIYEAEVIVDGTQGRRGIPIKDWFVAPRKTSIGYNEMVIEVRIKKPASHGGYYYKLGRYEGEDLAQATVAVMAMENNQYRIAFGSVGPRPIRALNIEKVLNGNSLKEEVLNKAKKLVDTTISPITDIRASKEYRMHMCKVMLERSLHKAKASLEKK